MGVVPPTVNTTPKPFCFVLMPFSDEFHDVYNLGIKEACKNAGTYCERVDEQIFNERILDRIYNQISKADIIIADMTGRNPNVFYEVGYAHALGKLTILLTRNADDIPFDLKHFPHIVYGAKISTLQSELEKRVKYFAENQGKSKQSIEAPLEFFMAGKKLENNSKALFSAPEDKSAPIRLIVRFDIHNFSNKIFDASNIRLGLILPIEFSSSSDASTVILPEIKCMHQLPKLGSILPDEWQSVSVIISVNDTTPVINKNHNCALRIFSEIGTRDLEFTLIIK